MSDNSVIIPVPVTRTEPCTVCWKVKSNQPVCPNSVVCLLLFAGGQHIESTLVSPDYGWVNPLKPNGSVVEPGACSHQIVMRDLCAECGANLRRIGGTSGDRIDTKVANIPMVHTFPDLHVSENIAAEIALEDERSLLAARKLVLLVDLDQTIIHTSNSSLGFKFKDIHRYRLPGSPFIHHTRFRPHLLRFLDSVSRYYQMHICTFGNRLYAHKLASLIDPKRKLFAHRILSRDECFNPATKSANLKALFPRGLNMVCIIDDRGEVWDWSPNLIHVKPYRFFPDTGDINFPFLTTPSPSQPSTTASPSTGPSQRGHQLPSNPQQIKSSVTKSQNASSSSSDNQGTAEKTGDGDNASASIKDFQSERSLSNGNGIKDSADQPPIDQDTVLAMPINDPSPASIEESQPKGFSYCSSGDIDGGDTNQNSTNVDVKQIVCTTSALSLSILEPQPEEESDDDKDPGYPVTDQQESRGDESSTVVAVTESNHQQNATTNDDSVKNETPEPALNSTSPCVDDNKINDSREATVDEHPNSQSTDNSTNQSADDKTSQKTTTTPNSPSKDRHHQHPVIPVSTSSPLLDEAHLDALDEDYLLRLQQLLLSIHTAFFRQYDLGKLKTRRKSLRQRSSDQDCDDDNGRSPSLSPSPASASVNSPAHSTNDAISPRNDEDQALPDVAEIICAKRARVLGPRYRITLSGLAPVNTPADQCLAGRLVRSLGARLYSSLQLPHSKPPPPDPSSSGDTRQVNASSTTATTSDDPHLPSHTACQNSIDGPSDHDQQHTTHLVACRRGTEKVGAVESYHQKKRQPLIHLVSPDWLFACHYEWRRLEEAKFQLQLINHHPLSSEQLSRAQRYSHRMRRSKKRDVPPQASLASKQHRSSSYLSLRRRSSSSSKHHHQRRKSSNQPVLSSSSSRRTAKSSSSVHRRGGRKRKRSSSSTKEMKETTSSVESRLVEDQNCSSFTSILTCITGGRVLDKDEVDFDDDSLPSSTSSETGSNRQAEEDLQYQLDALLPKPSRFELADNPLLHLPPQATSQMLTEIDDALLEEELDKASRLPFEADQYDPAKLGLNKSVDDSSSDSDSVSRSPIRSATSSTCNRKRRLTSSAEDNQSSSDCDDSCGDDSWSRIGSERLEISKQIERQLLLRKRARYSSPTSPANRKRLQQLDRRLAKLNALLDNRRSTIRTVKVEDQDEEDDENFVWDSDYPKGWEPASSNPDDLSLPHEEEEEPTANRDWMSCPEGYDYVDAETDRELLLHSRPGLDNEDDGGRRHSLNDADESDHSSNTYSSASGDEGIDNKPDLSDACWDPLREFM